MHLSLYLVPHLSQSCPIHSLDTDEGITAYILSNPKDFAEHARLVVSIQDPTYKYKDEKLCKMKKGGR